MDATTPTLDGLIVPAAWESHACAWMMWPCRGELWGDLIDHARIAYAAIARSIAESEPVRILARPEDAPEARLQCGRGCEIVPLEIEDSWARDILPTFTIDGEGGVAGIHWRFNGWGNRIRDFARDDELGKTLLDRLEMRRYEAPLVLEGGAIELDGRGTVITTEQCLLNPDRNPTLDRDQVEGRLASYLAVRRIIWLGDGLANDLMEGHVENVVRYVRPGLVLAHRPESRDSPNFDVTRDNLARLALTKDAFGREIEVIPVPEPAPQEGRNGNPAALSYLNFYLSNGAVIVPGFADPKDGEAAEIIGAAFRGRKVIQHDARIIAYGGGGIHSIVLEQPSGRALPVHNVA